MVGSSERSAAGAEQIERPIIAAVERVVMVFIQCTEQTLILGLSTMYVILGVV